MSESGEMTPMEDLLGLSGGAFLALDYVSQPEVFEGFVAYLTERSSSALPLGWQPEILAAMSERFMRLMLRAQGSMQ
jgi:hypothetical protein